MPFELSWYVPNRILMAHFWGSTTPEDNRRVSPEIIQFFEESPFPQIHIFMDDGMMEGLPGSLGQMREVAAFLAHPKAGWILGVAPVNAAVKFMGTFLIHFFKIKYKRFNNVTEASSFLIELEPDLKALLPESEGGSS